MKRKIQVGDVIAVKRWAMDGIMVREEWAPATVSYVDDNQVCAIDFRNKEMRAYPHGQGMYR